MHKNKRNFPTVESVLKNRLESKECSNPFKDMICIKTHYKVVVWRGPLSEMATINPDILSARVDCGSICDENGYYTLFMSPNKQSPRLYAVLATLSGTNDANVDLLVYDNDNPIICIEGKASYLLGRVSHVDAVVTGMTISEDGKRLLIKAKTPWLDCEKVR